MLRRHFSVIVAAVVLLLLLTGCGAGAKKLTQQGNEAYARAAYDEALGLYQAAQIKDPELAEPYYNAANALYREGQYAAALEQLQIALSYAEDETLAQRALFNSGNAAYNDQDTAAAVAAYTEALLLNPGDQDAKYNLELALQQQQEEQQQQDQQQEQQQDESSDDGTSEQQNQDAQPDESGSQEQQQQEPAQSENGAEQDQPQNEGQQGQPQNEQSSDQPQQGQGRPQSGQEQGQEQANGYAPRPGERMTAEQAEQLLGAIARRGQTLRERLGEIFMAPGAPPAQDW